MPREATSVAIRMGSLPSLKVRMVFSRFCCGISPWMQSASSPMRTKSSRRRWHMTFVLQKTMVRSSRSVRMSRLVISIFSSGGQVMEYCVMSGRLSVSAGTVISTSSRWYIHETVITSCEMVAENRPRLRRFLTFSMIFVTSSKKPMSSMRSASSNTTVCTLSNESVRRL